MAIGAGTSGLDTESSIPQLPPVNESLGEKQTWTFASSGWLFAYHFGGFCSGATSSICLPTIFGSQTPGLKPSAATAAGVVKLLKESLKDELRR